MKTPKPVPGGPGYLGTEQMMDLLGISYEGLRRATKRGELRAVKIAGRVLYPVHLLPGHAPTEPESSRG